MLVIFFVSLHSDFEIFKSDLNWQQKKEKNKQNNKRKQKRF